MIRRPEFLVLYASAIALAVGCLGPSNETAIRATPSEAESHHLLSTPTPQRFQATVTEPILNSSTSDLHKVKSGKVYDFEWSADSSYLFYRFLSEVWRYSVATSVSDKLEADEMPTQTYVNSLLEQLPSNAGSIGVSPTGSQVLYTLSNPHTENTVEPMQDGESNQKNRIVQLWMRENNSYYQIGMIEDCIFQYDWARDQKTVVVIGAPIPAHCSQHAWIVDLETRVVKPLFSREVFPSQLIIYGISPNGQNVLYRYESETILFIIETQKPIVLSDIPADSRSRWWIDNTNLLVNFSIGATSYISAFDLKQQSFRQLIGPQATQELGNELILDESISPDQKWLAFITGKGIYSPNGIWVMKLLPD